MFATFYVLFFRADKADSPTVSASTSINSKCGNNYLDIGSNPVQMERTVLKPRL
jgi:hypothetical protein